MGPALADGAPTDATPTGAALASTHGGSRCVPANWSDEFGHSRGDPRRPAVGTGRPSKHSYDATTSASSTHVAYNINTYNKVNLKHKTLDQVTYSKPQRQAQPMPHMFSP
eukprot:3773720-Prymnesium_polylepis.1